MKGTETRDIVSVRVTDEPPRRCPPREGVACDARPFPRHGGVPLVKGTETRCGCHLLVRPNPSVNQTLAEDGDRTVDKSVQPGQAHLHIFQLA